MTRLAYAPPKRKARPRLVRSILATAGFLALTGVLVAVQPARAPVLPGASDVSRAAVDLGTLGAPNDMPELAAVTLTSAPAPQAAPVMRAAAAAPAFSTDNSDLHSMTTLVLADLGVTAPAAPMDAATAGILANIRAVTRQTTAADAPRPRTDGLRDLVAQALREGQSDSYIDALVNEAAGRGDITVPKALVTNDGRVDTATILAAIVAQARIAAGEPAPPVIAGGDGVELRMIQKADGVIMQAAFYTVTPGDSLGAIAQRFYGNAARYSAIYDANRGILGSPDRIRIGQRLVIPTI